MHQLKIELAVPDDLLGSSNSFQGRIQTDLGSMKMGKKRRQAGLGDWVTAYPG